MKVRIIGKHDLLTKPIKQKLENNGIKDIKIISTSPLSSDDLVKNAADSEILIFGSGSIEYFSKEMINGLDKLKFISVLGVGTDFIDLDELKKRSITVSNLKGVNAEAVAEHCFGFILDLAKRITEADRGIREKGEFSYTPYMGKELYGKTLGIIGTGDIGKRVARIAGGFSMKILGVNRSSRKIPGIENVSLEILLKESDVIAVTVPLTPETENLLSEREFDLMKDGVIFVSTSREKIINKNAVLKALDSNKIFGFGFESEINTPIVKDDPLLNHNKVIITPHTAFYTEESNANYIKMTIENVLNYIKGEPIRVVV